MPQCALEGCDTLLKKTQKSFCCSDHYYEWFRKDRQKKMERDKWNWRHKNEYIDIDARMEEELEEDLKKVR